MNHIKNPIMAYIMNPPYNGPDRAKKPWITIVVDTITNAVPGSEFLFIVPTHWRTHPGLLYKPVLACLRTQLEFFEEHYVDSSTFGIGEDVSWWIARKKQDPKDTTVLEEYTYRDENNEVHTRRMEVYDGHPYFSTWQEACRIVCERKGVERYKSRGVSKTFKKLNEEIPDLVSKDRSKVHAFPLYNTTKANGIWYSKSPLKDFFEPKIIIDTSGTYYRANNQNPDGNPIIVFDSGAASAGKNTAVFVQKDLGSVPMMHFHWYITHPIMRFILQEKPSNYSRAPFIKELYKIPRIHKEIDTTKKLCRFLEIPDDVATQIYAYFSLKDEKVHVWDTLRSWEKTKG